MIGVGEFFKRIQNIRARQILAGTDIQKVIQAHTGVTVPLEEISVKNSVITLRNITQSLRSAIFIKKNRIIADLNQTESGRIITDIR